MGHRSCEFYVSLRGSCEFYISFRESCKFYVSLRGSCEFYISSRESCKFYDSLRGSYEFHVSLRRTFVRVFYDNDGMASKRLHFLNDAKQVQGFGAYNVDI
jgi:hypothetical protein